MESSQLSLSRLPAPGLRCFTTALAGLLLALSPVASGQLSNSFFNDADMTKIGVYYYPEAWPSNQWARDIANIKTMGLEFVHMGEFAWAFMEPREGEVT